MKKLILIGGIIFLVVMAGCVTDENKEKVTSVEDGQKLTPSEVVTGFYDALLQGQINKSISYCSVQLLEYMEDKTDKPPEESLREVYEKMKEIEVQVEVVKENQIQTIQINNETIETTTVDVRICIEEECQEDIVYLINENNTWKITHGKCIGKSSCPPSQ